MKNELKIIFDTKLKDKTIIKHGPVSKMKYSYIGRGEGKPFRQECYVL